MEAFERELQRQLRAALPGGGQGVLIQRPRLPLGFEHPQAPWTAELDFKLPLKGVGAVPFAGTIREEGGPARRVTGLVEIDRAAMGVQARRLIRRGERIDPEDLTAFGAPLSHLPTDAVQSVESASGCAARREIRPGLWITGGMLENPKVVRRRQAVLMRLSRGPLTITTKGLAMENGAVGDVIRVQNSGSGRQVMARILDREVVQVVH
jgi:flagella basal body P-ring formation protein FlgA